MRVCIQSAFRVFEPASKSSVVIALDHNLLTPRATNGVREGCSFADFDLDGFGSDAANHRAAMRIFDAVMVPTAEIGNRCFSPTLLAAV